MERKNFPIATNVNKVTELDAMISCVANGDCLAIGGGLSAREPIAALHALIRSGCNNLELIGSAHGIDIDLLCGAGAVAICAESYVGFEQDFGMAPNYRRASESGAVQIRDNCCYTLVQQLRATISGVPFMPITSVSGTDLMGLHPEYKTMICPFTGKDIVLVPALQPDVAIIHAQYGDQHGNLHIQGPPVADVLFAKAARTVIATVERIVSREELSEKGVTIPYFYVSALAEVPFGAHPTSCYPLYAYDRAHYKTYYDAAKQGAKTFHERYVEPYILSCSSHHAYFEKIGGENTRTRLSEWRESHEQWMRLYD